MSYKDCLHSLQQDDIKYDRKKIVNDQKKRIVNDQKKGIVHNKKKDYRPNSFHFVVYNRYPFPIKLFQILDTTDKNNEFLYAKIMPNQTFKQFTYADQKWVLRKADYTQELLLKYTQRRDSTYIRTPNSMAIHKDKYVSTHLRFVNKDKDHRKVNVFWLNYKGEEIKYATLWYGQGYRQQSWVSHQWNIRYMDGTLKYTTWAAEKEDLHDMT